MTSHIPSSNGKQRSFKTGGFTLIELLLVIALITIIMTLALPVYSNYMVRSKIHESLNQANGTKAIVNDVCEKDGYITSLDKVLAENIYIKEAIENPYIQNIQVSGSCTAPIITVTTKNTGQSPHPVILMSGELSKSSEHIEWTCSSKNTPNRILPESCRS